MVDECGAAPVEPIAVVRTYGELRQALHMRADALNITRSSIDHVSGLQGGYNGKCLGKRSVRSAIGRTTFGPLLSSLGLKLLVVEDEAAFKFVKRHEPKKKHHARAGKPLATAIFWQFGVGEVYEDGSNYEADFRRAETASTACSAGPVGKGWTVWGKTCLNLPRSDRAG